MIRTDTQNNSQQHCICIFLVEMFGGAFSPSQGPTSCLLHVLTSMPIWTAPLVDCRDKQNARPETTETLTALEANDSCSTFTLYVFRFGPVIESRGGNVL